jgi:hypothetical protein
VLCVGRRRCSWDTAQVRPADEQDLTFLGFLTFLDPPKEDAARVLRELAALGISVRMVTGDNHLAAAHVAWVALRSSRRWTPYRRSASCGHSSEPGTTWATWATGSTMRRRCTLPM